MLFPNGRDPTTTTDEIVNPLIWELCSLAINKPMRGEEPGEPAGGWKPGLRERALTSSRSLPDRRIYRSQRAGPVIILETPG